MAFHKPVDGVDIYHASDITQLTNVLDGTDAATALVLAAPVSVTGTFASVAPSFTGLAAAQALSLTKDLRRSRQTPAFSATPAAPDPTLGEIYAMGTLTASVTAIPNPVNAAIGQHLRFYWTQDATGGRTVAYSGINYRTGGATAFVTTLSTVTIDDFECIDGTIWRLISRITGQAI